MGKGIALFDILVDGKSKVVNFCNVTYTLKLEYNLLLIVIIKKANYLILAKTGKITIFDDKENIALKATRIETSYLINILANKKTSALASLHLILHNHVL